MTAISTNLYKKMQQAVNAQPHQKLELTVDDIRQIAADEGWKFQFEKPGKKDGRKHKFALADKQGNEFRTNFSTTEMFYLSVGIRRLLMGK